MKTIVLDPGHGQYGNQYPADKRFFEGTQMFRLGEFLKAELTSYGCTVVTTRKLIADDPALAGRGALANEVRADLFLSLHSNAIGLSGSTATRGVEIYYSMLDEAWNKPFAEGLGKVIAQAMNTPYRFAVSKGMPTQPNRDYFQVVRSAAEGGCRRAMLIEHGYHTNPEDTAFLANLESLKALASAEAAYIAAQFGLKRPEEGANEVEKFKKWNAIEKGFRITGGIWRTAVAKQILADLAFLCEEAYLEPIADLKGNVKQEVRLGKYVGSLADAQALIGRLNDTLSHDLELWSD